MPIERPTLPALINQTLSDFQARQGTDDVLRRADAQVHSRVAAGAVHGLYGYAAWVADQILPDRAEEDVLERHASVRGVPRLQAESATGSVAFTVQAGAGVPAGTELRALDGQRYATTADATGVAPDLTAPVEAVLAGAAGNRAAGQTLTLVSPVDGVASNALAGELEGGADIEDVEAWRARLLDRIRRPPQGGSAADYEAWAKEVPGVTRAWCSPGEMGGGTVVVRFVRDNDDDLIPGPGEIEAVADYIASRRPVTANVYVVAPIADALDFEFSGLFPDTPAVRASVQAELADLLLREGDPGGTTLHTHVRAAISQATGENDYVLVSPAANVVHATGHIPVLGTINWPT